MRTKVGLLKLDFESLTTASDVQQALEMHLSIGESTQADVLSFLEEQNLTHSGVRSEAEVIAELTKKPYDSVIACRVAAPREQWQTSAGKQWPWLWLWAKLESRLISYAYFIHFHFKDNVLVEIVVAKIGTGL